MRFLLFKLQLSNVGHCLPFVLFIFTFVFRYVGFGYTNVVFRLSLYLLSLTLQLYLVHILCFVVICITIRLQQSNLPLSTTCKALLDCKYEIIFRIPCCNVLFSHLIITKYNKDQDILHLKTRYLLARGRNNFVLILVALLTITVYTFFS